MNILITGICGFIGSHLAEYYANQGHHVIGIDNLRKTPNNYLFLKKNFLSIDIKIADLRNYNQVRKIITHFSPDVIFHCAGQVAVTTSLIKPYEDFQINTVGTVNLLEILRQLDLDIPFIFTSTNKVYGTLPNSSPTNETFRTDIPPFTPYGCSKNCAEKYVLEYSSSFGIRTGVFRMSCIYGTRQFGTEDQGWVAHFIISALQDKRINIYGDGRQVRDVLYVSDLVEAFDKFLHSDKGGYWNIGGGNENRLSLLELIDILEQELDKKIEYEFHDWRPNDQKVYISDIRKINEDLNWKPKINPKEGIKKIIEWFRDET